MIEIPFIIAIMTVVWCMVLLGNPRINFNSIVFRTSLIFGTILYIGAVYVLEISGSLLTSSLIIIYSTIFSVIIWNLIDLDLFDGLEELKNTTMEILFNKNSNRKSIRKKAYNLASLEELGLINSNELEELNELIQRKEIVHHYGCYTKPFIINALKEEFEGSDENS
jgi:hypothetical protein